MGTYLFLVCVGGVNWVVVFVESHALSETNWLRENEV